MFACLALCFLANCGAAAGKESVEYSPNNPHDPIKQPHILNGEHNSEYDHEAIIGSQKAHAEFDQLTEIEARNKLREMVGRMDKDRNGMITVQELTDWIILSFRSLDIEEATVKMETDDSNSDGFVSWEEFLYSVYGLDTEQVADLYEDKNQEIRDFMQLVEGDQKRFEIADEDGDGKLSQSEYAAFLHPAEYKHMQNYELNQSIALHDKNGDGYVSFFEFVGPKDRQRESLIVDEENFKTYDVNGDGRLDAVEVQEWLVPDQEQIARDEARHLMSETDRDNDNMLTVTEILGKQSLWVGSQATQAIHLTHDPSEL